MFLHLTQIVTEKKKIFIIKITWPPNNNNKHQYQSLSIYNTCSMSDRNKYNNTYPNANVLLS